MSEYYLIKGETLTSMADNIKKLAGVTGEMSLGELKDAFGNENVDLEDNLETQSDLIAQIQTALEGKAGGAAEPVLQEKTVTPSTSQQIVQADSGYDGLSKVTVNAMSTATQATPSISVSSSGLITASATQTAGYVSAGTKSATKQLTTQAAKTITPSTSSQTAVASGRYTTGAVTVAAIPSSYVQPSGTLSVTANGTHDVKNYASVNVNVSGGGSSGTSNFKTCTISGLLWYPVHYTTVENGEIVYKSGLVDNFMGTITVLCDSLIYYAVNEPEIGEPTASGGFEILYYVSGSKYVVLKAPSTVNAVGEYWVADEPLEEEIPDL